MQNWSIAEEQGHSSSLLYKFFKNKTNKKNSKGNFPSSEKYHVAIRILLFIQVTTLGETAERLCESHPDATEDLQKQKTELNEAWDTLQSLTNDRKESLNEAHKFFLFLSKAR